MKWISSLWTFWIKWVLPIVFFASVAVAFVASLVVKKGRIKERIALFNVSHVSHSRWVNPRRLTLTLRSPGKLGGEISFIPPVRVFSFTFRKHPLVDELIERIDRARFGGRSLA
jgi:hypothetical protein